MLGGLGISTLGDFIYLIAINVLVLQLTGSATAVAGLWIIAPIASVCTKFWSGSIIDRLNIRVIMIGTDIFRACILVLLPLFPSVWPMYICLFVLAVAKSFFEPASISYMTYLVPEAERKRFNSFRSLMTSSAFLIGPAIAGGLLLVTTVHIAIWINAVSFLLSAALLYVLPNVQARRDRAVEPVRIQALQRDWQQVWRFSRNHRFIALVYLLSQLFMVIALGMDAQEVVFTQQVLDLSETDYGLLVSLTGMGSMAGAMMVSLIAHKLSMKVLIGFGYFMVAIGYLIYAFAVSFWTVAIGFIILGFFHAFAGTGIMTFYQNNVPAGIMGRISSIYGLFQSMLQVIFVLAIGFTGDLLPLRYSIIAASLLMLVLSFLYLRLVGMPSKTAYFDEKRASSS